MQAAGLECNKGVMLGTGTAWVINGRTSRSLFDEEHFLIHPGRDIHKDSFGFIMSLGEVGRGFDMLRDKLGIDSKKLSALEKTFRADDIPGEKIEFDLSRGVIKPECDAEHALRRYMEWAGSWVAFIQPSCAINA